MESAFSLLTLSLTFCPYHQNQKVPHLPSAFLSTFAFHLEPVTFSLLPEALEGAPAQEHWNKKELKSRSFVRIGPRREMRSLMFARGYWHPNAPR